jgi:hypothetical protein
MRDLAGGRLPPVPAGVSVRRLRQVHGTTVVVADVGPGRTDPWAPGAMPPEGDAVVASTSAVALAVLTADCAPVALGSPEGVFGAVHVGWRGLAAGVVARSVEAMGALGATAVVAGLGPCIGPCCYEFAPDDLAAVGAACGTDVEARTTQGRPSLDLPGAVRARLEAAGVPLVTAIGDCTVCTPGYFSHRARRDEGRQALVVWRAR